MWRSRCTHDLYNVEGVSHTMDGESDSSPLLRNLQQGVHKRCKYSSQNIRTCIVFKLARFQCLNFPALPIFQTHSWIYLAFAFSSQAFFMIIKTCVCMFVSEIVFFFSLLCGSYYTCTRTELIAKYVWPALQMFSEKILIF